MLLSDTFNSSLIKQMFIIKKPEKPQITASVQNRAAVVKPPVKKTCQLRSTTVHKAVKEKQEKELSNHENSKQKKMIAAVLESTKGQENVLAPKIAPFCSSLRSNIFQCKICFFSCCKSCPHTSLVFLVMLNVFICVSGISGREEYSHADICSCTSGSYV